MGRYSSGQRGETVNLLRLRFVGSNPALPTISSLRKKFFSRKGKIFYVLLENNWWGLLRLRPKQSNSSSRQNFRLGASKEYIPAKLKHENI